VKLQGHPSRPVASARRRGACGPGPQPSTASDRCRQAAVPGSASIQLSRRPEPRASSLPSTSTICLTGRLRVERCRSRHGGDRAAANVPRFPGQFGFTTTYFNMSQKDGDTRGSCDQGDQWEGTRCRRSRQAGGRRPWGTVAQASNCAVRIGPSRRSRRAPRAFGARSSAIALTSISTPTDRQYAVNCANLTVIITKVELTQERGV
jgi:hypothetical protein